METSLAPLAQGVESGLVKLKRLEALVNASPVVMFTCKAGGDFATTFVTEGVRPLWGYEPEDFLSEPGFWSSRVHPDDAGRVFHHLGQLLESGTQRYDYRFRTKSGEYRWTHDELRLARDAAGEPVEVAGYCFDISEQKLAEAAVRENEARREVIFNSTSDLQSLFRVEPGGGFVTEAVNRALTENFQSRMGQDAAAFVGRDFAELLAATGIGAEEIKARRALYCRAVEQGTIVRFDTPTSHLRDALEVSVYPVFDQQGNCTHLLWNGRNIAKRVKAEAARREIEERYTLVTEAIHQGIFDWNLVTGASYLSPRYKEMLGYRDDELPSSDESFFGRIHPEDAPRMLENRERYPQDAAMVRFEDELRLLHRDGTYRWVLSRGRIVRNEHGEATRIVGAIADMTDRLESAAKLAASEKRLRDIISSLFGFVGLFTLDGKLIEYNRAVLDAAGARPEELLGQPFWDAGQWTRPQHRTRVKEMMMRAAQGEVVRFEAGMMEGTHEIVADITLGPLRDEHGAVCNIVAHGVDITARKQAEADLVRAKEAAEAASRAKSEFLANMSHEIRTPMNGIIGLTEVLLDTPLDDEQREYLTLVQASAESLLTIINDILDVSKIEAGKLSLEIREFDLRESVAETLRGLRVSAGAKGLSLVDSIHPEVPARVAGDAGRLRQILMNLVGNAIKFTGQGEISVLIEPSRDSAETLHFAVRDTGIGIPAEKQRIIFEAFTQADGSITRKFGGTGLGLTIASRLVSMMNGRIWLESQEGQGSTFHFTARVAPVETKGSGLVGPAAL